MGIIIVSLYEGFKVLQSSFRRATVVAGETTLSGATVTWSGNNDAVATIDASTGAVTLVGAGVVTFTAAYAGVSGEYKASSANYEMTVTDSTPLTGGDVTFDAKADRHLTKNTGLDQIDGLLGA